MFNLKVDESTSIRTCPLKSGLTWAFKVVNCKPCKINNIVVKTYVSVIHGMLILWKENGISMGFDTRFDLRQWFLTFLANYPFWWVWKPNYPQNCQKICPKNPKKLSKNYVKKFVIKICQKIYQKNLSKKSSNE